MKKLIFILSLTLIISSSLFSQSEECKLAKDIAKKGVKEFKTDMKKGLKLLIKAEKMCPQDAGLNYNLAVAFYRYGIYDKAELFLKKAIALSEEGNKTKWQNNLSEILLKEGKHSEALKISEKIISQSKKPQYIDTYAKALLLNGNYMKALSTILDLKNKYPDETRLNKTYQMIVNTIVSGFYEKFKNGNPDKAVAIAKRFSEEYPNVKEFKEAYSKLLDALIGNVDVNIPERSVSTPKNAGYNVSIGEVDIEKNIPEGRLKKKYAVAVIIANQNYSKFKRGISDVKYAHRDAKVMKEYLIKVLGYSPDNIIYMTDITSADFRTVFGTRDNPSGKLRDYIRAGKSEVFIYYVGHGAPGKDGNEAYFVPIDADADYIENTGYPLSVFYRNLKKLPAKEITVVIDSCFSGNTVNGQIFKKISPAMVRNIKPVVKVPKGVIFCSADKDQVSVWYPEKKHSLFTYFFLKGLKGEADFDKDKKITVGELKKYLLEEVPYWARREAGRRQLPVVVGYDKRVLAVLK